MNKALLIVCSLLTLSAAPAFADGNAQVGLVVSKSANPVGATLDALERIVKEKGFTVFSRIDHAAGARAAGQSLRPTELLIFGNPKVGTALMSSRQSAALDLPIRVAAWEDANGQVWIGYDAPARLAERHGIQDRDEVIEKMSGALANLTAAAAAKQ
jgi:uncharacterized protein (DUF302 family)